MLLYGEKCNGGEEEWEEVKGEREKSHNHFPIRLLIFFLSQGHASIPDLVRGLSVRNLWLSFAPCALAAYVQPDRKSDHAEYKKEG